MNEHNWRIEQGFEDHLRGQTKRVDFEQRKPTVRKASDLLGPLLGPSSSVFEDSLNGDIAAGFNGMFIVPPGTPNSPDIAKWFVAEVINSALGGVQVLRTFKPGDAPHQSYMRGWELTAGTRAYSDWQDIGAGGGAEIPDTGWVDLTLSSGRTARSGADYVPQGRRIGDAVYMRGQVLKNFTGQTIMLTLPPELWPSKEHQMFPVITGTTTNVGLWVRSTTGEVLCPAQSTSGSSTYYVALNASWAI